MTQNNIKKIALSCIPLIAPILSFGQEVNKVAVANQATGIDLNTVLLFVAAFLLIPIYITGNAFLFAANDYAKKSRTTVLKKAVALILLFFCYQFVQAQATGANANESSTCWSTCLILGLIVFEVLLIAFFSLQTLKLIKRASLVEPLSTEDETITTPAPIGVFEKFWNKINSFKPIAEEANIDTGHSYDGIRELDNITPPWFVMGFVLTIIFAIIYLYRYHVVKSAPLQAEEYKIEMADAALEKANYLATHGNTIDENSVVMLGTADIEIGKKLFTEKTCVVCHASTGGSMPGGVGPNLTDNYWIHGGAIKDIFKTITNGWPGTSMISWKEQLSPKQIASIASYIMSIRGTNPPGAKEPQGELIKEVTSPSDTSGNDTLRLKK